MDLYLLRHGIAGQNPPGGRDRDRRLTPQGETKLRAALQLARLGGVRPTLILASPYVRALETAAIAADVFEYNGAVLRSSALTPESTPEALWDEVRIHVDEPSVLVVSHEPLLSATASWMLAPDHANRPFEPAEMRHIAVSAGAPGGTLKFRADP